MKHKSKWFITLIVVLICCFTAALFSACKKVDDSGNGNENGGGDNTQTEQPSDTQKGTYDMSGVVFTDLTVPYDGQPHSILATNLPYGVVATYEGNAQTEIGTYIITAHFNGDTDNYESIPDKTAKLTIEPKTIDVSNVVFEDTTVEYDGMPHSIQATNLPEGVTVIYDTSIGYTDVGEHTITVYFLVDNVSQSSMLFKTATLTITKRELTVKFQGDQVIPYDGKAHKEVTATPTNLIGTDEVEIILTYSGDMIETGEYTVTATIADNDKYVLTKNNTYKITITNSMHTVTFRQEGQPDRTVTVPDLGGLQAKDIPTPVGVLGYDVTWEDVDLTNITEDIIVNAVKTPTIYTIYYHLGNDTDYEEYTDTYTIESADKVLGEATRTGYKFIGWHTDKELNEHVTEIKHGSYGDIHLYAGWTIINYTITYHLNGGENSENNLLTYTVEDTVTLLNATKRGYDFEGWFTDAQFSEQKEGIEKGSTGNLNLYAKWEIVNYTITYYLFDGTNHADNPDTYTVKTPLIVLKSPTKTGAEFGGWFDNANFMGTRVTTLADGAIGDIKLYAYWIEYRIVSASGLEVDNSTMTVNGDVSNSTKNIDLVNRITVSDGCTWKMYSDFEGIHEIPLRGISLEVGNNSAYIIVFHPDGEHFARYVLNVYRLDIKSYTFMNVGSVYNSGTIEEKSAVTAPEAPERTGYIFNGWAVQGSTTIVDFPYTVTEDITFVAQYTPITYTITYHLNEGTNSALNPKNYDIETPTITLLSPTRTGYTFMGWFEEQTFQNRVTQIGIGTHGDIELYAKWTPTEYSITYYYLYNGENAEDNPESYTIEDSDITLKPATRNGYTFEGWFEDDEFNTHVTVIESGSYGDIELYAKWELINYTITYYLNNGDNSEDNPTSYNVEDTITLQPATRISYSFAGWFSDEQFVTKVAEIKIGSYGNLNLYAKWIFATVGLTYSLSSSKYTVTGYTGTSTEVIIPSEWNGYPVTSISSSAFKDCTSLNSIEIPDSVTSIGSAAFSGCSNLESITIPFVGGSVKTSSNTYQYPFGYIFGTSSYTGGVATMQYYYGSSTSITTSTTYYIPATLKSVTVTGGNILYGAFYRCTSLTSITIPDSVTSIGNSAFYYCESLASITIPDSVTSIGNSAFYYCESLASITIPDSVTSIGRYAFEDCTSLETVYWNATNCTSAGSSSYQIFNGCTAMTTVIIGENVQTIPAYAFHERSSLTSVTIPDSVTAIGSYAFYGCTSLSNIYISDVAKWCKISGISYLMRYGTSNKHIFLDGTEIINLIIPDSVTTIGSYAFYGCTSLTSVTIPDSVTSIGESAFERCTSLTSVTIGNSVTTIGYEAFYYCTSLESVTIGNGVTSIGVYAFYWCTSLTSITIPDSVTIIGDGAFYGCTSLETVYYGGTAEQWSKISVSYNNSPLYDATRYYYSEEYPFSDEVPKGNFWHYDETTGEIVIWTKEN